MYLSYLVCKKQRKYDRHVTITKNNKRQVDVEALFLKVMTEEKPDYAMYLSYLVRSVAWHEKKSLEDGGNVVLLDHLLIKCFEGLVNLISRELSLPWNWEMSVFICGESGWKV
jgi:hypothetical protein